jgi:hypothetical protein
MDSKSTVPVYSVYFIKIFFKYIMTPSAITPSQLDCSHISVMAIVTLLFILVAHPAGYTLSSRLLWMATKPSNFMRDPCSMTIITIRLRMTDQTHSYLSLAMGFSPLFPHFRRSFWGKTMCWRDYSLLIMTSLTKG